jgi:peptidoglycan L-alanyl-D-glutamate endopeptidase CwlK
MTFSLSPRSRGNMAGLHPDLVRIVEGAIVTTSVDFGITAPCVRTAEEQHMLYLRGVSQKDGYKNKSNHQPWADGLGHAVDLTPYLDGNPILDDSAWKLYPAVASAMSRSAAALGLSGRLTWGGNWLEPMGKYGSSPDDMTAAMERYKRIHPGPDWLDGPHFEFR